MTDCILVHVNCPSQDEAETIAKALIDKKLVSCANIQAPHDSVYHWNGKIVSRSEVCVLFKTRQDSFEVVRNEILKHHSYECVPVWATQVIEGHTPFLEWIKKETL